jgi:preprotein translocase subunit SecA
MMAQDSLEEMITDMRHGVVEDIVAKYAPSDAYPEAWDIDGLAKGVESALNLVPPLADWAKEEGITDDEMHARLMKLADEAYAARVEKNSPDMMRYVEKQVVLQVLDHLWREHLVTLDHLRQVIGWRGLAQRDPLNEYKSEAFELFDELITHLREVTTAQLSRVEVAFEPVDSPGAPMQVALNDQSQLEAAFVGQGALPDARDYAAQNYPPLLSQSEGEVATLARAADDPSTWGRVGRNEACPCGSGKKFKHCHGQIG